MKPRGFTLIELLVVVAIIGILAAIAVPNYTGAQIKARVAAVKMDLRTLSQAIDSYRVDRAKYPRPPLEPHGFFVSTIVPALTSPISYLNTPPVNDPFGLVEEAKMPLPLRAPIENDTFYTPPVPRYSYVYVSYRVFSEWQGSPQLKRDAYLVASVGPDRVDSSLVYLPFPELSALPIRSIQDTVYSPTNGIHSAGDIGQFGGVISVGGMVGG